MAEDHLDAQPSFMVQAVFEEEVGAAFFDSLRCLSLNRQGKVWIALIQNEKEAIEAVFSQEKMRYFDIFPATLEERFLAQYKGETTYE